MASLGNNSKLHYECAWVLTYKNGCFNDLSTNFLIVIYQNEIVTIQSDMSCLVP